MFDVLAWRMTEIINKAIDKRTNRCSTGSNVIVGVLNYNFDQWGYNPDKEKGYYRYLKYIYS